MLGLSRGGRKKQVRSRGKIRGPTLVRPGLSASSSKGSCTGSAMILRPYKNVVDAPKHSTPNTMAPYLYVYNALLILDNKLWF